MKRSYYVIVGIAVVLAAVLYLAFTPSGAQRFARQAAQALNAGDLEAAQVKLGQMAEMTSDSVDLSSIMSIRMAVSVAQILRDAQLIVDYEGLAMMFENEEDAARPDPGYNQVLQALKEELRTDQQSLLAMAQGYRARHYQAGLRLQSPLEGTLDLMAGQSETLDAFRALVAGDADTKAQEAYRAGVAREAVGAVLRLVIVQPPEQGSDFVALNGSLDLAELWWLIAANSIDAAFTEQALLIVLEETEGRPNHPARQRAEDALREVRRLG